MLENIQYALSTPGEKALNNGNSVAGDWMTLQTLTRNPSHIYTDGIAAGGGPGDITCPTRLRIHPYADSAPGVSFSFRLYGWSSVQAGKQPPYTHVWFPYLLAEFACVTCGICGPPPDGPSQSQFPLGPSEYLCDTITLVQGQLGLNSYINAAASGLPGFVVLDLVGTQYWQIDFKNYDTASQIGMNAIWCEM